jgi:hypothetical protein
MKGYDYRFRLIGNKGTKDFAYSALIDLFDLKGMELSGRPIEQGGAPQALALKGLIEKAMKGLKVEVYFNGAQVF